MDASLFQSSSVALAILKMFLLVGLGFAFYSFRLFEGVASKSVSNLVIYLLFPAVIFLKITNSFDPSEGWRWLLLPLAGVVISLLGMLLGSLISVLLGQKALRREMVCVMGFQNCAYLPMTLIAFLGQSEVTDRILAFIFLFVLGFNLIIWSFVPLYLGNDHSSFEWKKVFNVPVLALLGGVMGVFLLGNGWLPEFVEGPTQMLANASFPMSLILLGVFLAEHKGYHIKAIKAVVGHLVGKMFLFPAVILGVLVYLPIPEEYKFVIFLEATLPTAVTLALIGGQQKANNQYISGTIFYSHILAIATMPAWLWLFFRLVN